MDTSIERLLRPHLDAMWADRDALVRRVTAAVTGSVPSYATTPSSEVWIGMTRILERAAHGNPFGAPTEADRLAALGTGAQGAGAGIAVDDLVTAVLLGAREVEHDVLDRAAADGVAATTLLDASRRARVWAEQVAVWAVQGLRGAAADDVEPHVRHERLLAELAAGDLDGARTTLVRLGLDPAAPWWAVVAVDGGPAATALRLANHGGVWAVPSAPGADLTNLAGLTGLVPRPPSVPGELCAGVSGPAYLDALPGALRDATRAARTAHRFGYGGGAGLADLGLLVPLHEDPALAERLHRRWVAPLAAEPRHDLVRTLDRWLEREGQVDAVARDLGVHANTVRNRLSRVTGLLGAAWRTPRHRAELWAALQVSPVEVVGTSIP
ncbi:PucR family transcriptional regulator [Pimelobacter simplex]|uniref:PucR family transcriptional regulator n=1 Tax=Nocardioides simplex TaxID=2045 RepID=UPI003AAD5C17